MVKPRKVIRRMTPADDPVILAEWRALETHYLDKLGMSRYRAHLRIASEYQTSRSVVYRSLSGYRPEQQHDPRSYSDRATNSCYRQRQTLLADFRNNPDRYIASCYQSPDEALSLEELSVRLSERYAFLPRVRTLQKLADYGHPRTGGLVIEKALAAPESSPLYRLVTHRSTLGQN